MRRRGAFSRSFFVRVRRGDGWRHGQRRRSFVRVARVGDGRPRRQLRGSVRCVRLCLLCCRFRRTALPEGARCRTGGALDAELAFDHAHARRLLCEHAFEAREFGGEVAVLVALVGWEIIVVHKCSVDTGQYRLR